MSIVKVSWSGGKDSTADVILNTLEGNHCKIVCFIPMLTHNIPLIRKAHFEHIKKCANIFEQWGHEVNIVTGRTYVEHFYRVKTRGKYKGTNAGYDLGIGYCKFRDYSKVATLKKIDVGYYDYESIGIAYDETNRHAQLNGKLRSILVEKHYTELDAKNLCIEYNMLSPQYELSGRDGCCICPNSKDIEYVEYLKEFPVAIDILRNMDKYYNTHPEMKRDYPFRDKLNFTERMEKLGI